MLSTWKLTEPGLAEVAVPLAVFSVSQPPSDDAVAVQFTAELPETSTKNDPPGLPGEEPNDMRNWLPAGLRVMVAFCATSSVTGMLADPAEVFTKMVLW